MGALRFDKLRPPRATEMRLNSPMRLSGSSWWRLHLQP